MDPNQQQPNALKKPVTSKLANASKIFNRALNSKSQWPDKDEFLDVVYWLRQCIGFLIGVLWGCLSLKGFAAIILFFLINASIVYFYSTVYQKVDEDEFGGVWEIIKEGFMTSFSTFLVSWIVVYSALNY